MRLTIAALVLSTTCAFAGGFVVKDVRVFDGDRTIEKTDVAVRDGRIVSVGSGVASRGLETIEGRGKTLLPGLIDAHVHVFPGAQQDALRFGVTTELDMFSMLPFLKDWQEQRRSLRRTSGADTWSAGIGVTAPGGHPTEMSGPFTVPVLAPGDDARAFVDKRVKEGSDYIKVIIEDLAEYPGRAPMPTLSRDQVCAVVSAAHADGKMAVVHVQTEAAAREAMDCGADGLAHLYPDRPADPVMVAQVKAHGMFIETTAAVWAGASGTGMADKLAADPRVALYLSQAQLRSLAYRGKTTMPDFFSNALASIRRYHAAGVPLLASTDAPNPSTAHGVSLHEELQIYVQAGYTPAEALHAATGAPADVFHLGDRGRIRKGDRADLVLVDGDPTRDIADTLSIERIWKNGFAVDRAPKEIRR
ncbi:MAG: amidohydrolase family protein [Alphaproteobacteria bacterium]|nr:amidohydrolase family protein [Alphaproteobacteria bacterium]